MLRALHGLAHAPGQGAPTMRTAYADVVVYGATVGGVIAACDAHDAGLSVILVGGWRENRIGGMMAGGLSATDLYNNGALGGATRQLFHRIMSHYQVLAPGVLPANLWFEPHVAQQEMEAMIAARGIPVHWTRGIVGCAVSSTGPRSRRIDAFSTRDGKSFAGRMFIDASYEGDLVLYSGCRFRLGREAATEFGESKNGIQTGFVGNKQFYAGSVGAWTNVDPFVVPGNPSSGLIYGVQARPGNQGEGDDRVQGFNFRMCVSTDPASRMPLMQAPPDGYAPARYEKVLRYCAELSRLGLEAGVTANKNFMLNFATPPRHVNGLGKWDQNANGPVSTDLFNLNRDYVLTDWRQTGQIDYARREAIWREHRRWIEGWYWTFQGHPDARVWSALREDFRQYWLANDEFLDPYPGDPVGFPSQYYVREGVRLDNEFRPLTQADGERGDDVPYPLADEVIALAAYEMDSHHRTCWAWEYEPGKWRLRNEGDYFLAAGGANRITPIPYRALRPRREDATNLLTPWSIACTAVFFSMSRMEPTLGCLGSACAMAAMLALRDGVRQTDMQDIDVVALRGELRARDAALEPL